MLKRHFSFFKTVGALMAAVMLFSCLSVGAATVENDRVPYTNYTYWTGFTNKKPVETKALFNPYRVIDLSFVKQENSSFEYVCSDKENNTYLLDGKQGIIYIFNSEYKLVKSIKSLSGGGNEYTFSGAKGIYVDSEGLLYVADTENERVLCCKDEEVKDIILKPDSSIIPADFSYTPIRVEKDKNGYLYVLCEGSYYGLMVFSKNGDFLGFFGANKVATTVFGALKDWLTSAFETKEKHDGTAKKLPYQLSDISMSYDGFICGVIGEDVGQIKMFAPTGANILRAAEQFDVVEGDQYNFGDFPNSYVEKTSAYGVPVSQKINAVTTDNEGYIYALDSTQGRIYMYDSNCNLLTVFGGGTGLGNQVGTFVTPGSVTCRGEDLVVLDLVNGNLTIFRINEFGKSFKTAQTLTNQGEYAKAKPYWEAVNAQDKNCQLAYIGLAKASLSEEKYDESMAYAKSGLDQATYSQAYKAVRNRFVRENLWWVLIIVVTVITAAVIALRKCRKKGITLIKNEKLKAALKTLSHPIEVFSAVRNENKGSMVIATVHLILFYVATVSSALFGGFMYNIVNISDFNAIYTLFGTVGLVLLYVIINWLACVLFEGKGNLRSIYCTGCYCLQPLILYSVFYLIASYIIIPTSNAGFTLIKTAFTAVFIVWILLSITVVHDFSFTKALSLGIVIVIGMGIVLFIAFIMLTLGQDLLGFVMGIIKEAMLR